MTILVYEKASLFRSQIVEHRRRYRVTGHPVPSPEVDESSRDCEGHRLSADIHAGNMPTGIMSPPNCITHPRTLNSECRPPNEHDISNDAQRQRPTATDN